MSTPSGKTLRQAALEVGVPPILIVFAVVDGVRKEVDDPLNDGADVHFHFHGTMTGGEGAPVWGPKND